MKYNHLGDKVFDGGIIAALVLLSFVMVFPFYYMVVISFSSYSDYVNTKLLLWPKHWVLDSYVYIFSSVEFVRSIGVTVYITVMGTLLNLIATSSMAYALSRDIPGKKFFNFLVLFTFLFSGGMIPTYLIVKSTGLLDTYWALIIPGLINAFNMIIMRQFFMNIPGELIDSARIDGASELKIYISIVLPLSKPVLAAFGLFYAVDHWNTFFDAIIYLNDSRKWTIQVILRQIVIMGDSANALHSSAEASLYKDQHAPPPETIGMAAILVATVPILCVYPFLQKYFAKGVMLGSVKE
jgi:putative aldouronate transport system permease protein